MEEKQRVSQHSGREAERYIRYADEHIRSSHSLPLKSRPPENAYRLCGEILGEIEGICVVPRTRQLFFVCTYKSYSSPDSGAR